MAGIHEFSAKDIDGEERSLGVYRNKAMLIVNVASQCGFTPQYRGLQALYEKFRERDFVVLGFPCNQFGHQEPGDEAQIQRFCATDYGVSFPLFAKIQVNGANAHPLYRYLKREARGLFGSESIKWNFTKFLVGKDGRVLKRYAPTVAPASIEKDVMAVLDNAPIRSP